MDPAGSTSHHKGAQTQLRPVAPGVHRSAGGAELRQLGRLVRGEDDAAVLSYHAGQRFAGRLYPGLISRSPNMFLELPLAVAVAKGKNEPLLTELNEGIAAIRADGTWKRIKDRWVGR